MIKVNVKPLSVNQAWQGKRYKTKLYQNYEKKMIAILPKLDFKIEKTEKLSIAFVFGFSSIKSDLDNPVKPLLDIFCKKYLFDDSQIFQINISKKKVEKGNDFIAFNIEKII